MNDLSDELSDLTKAVAESNRKHTLMSSFAHGILVGLGSTIGAIVAITILVYLLRNLVLVPYFGPLGRLLPKLESALEQTSGNGGLPTVVPAPSEPTKEPAQSSPAL